MVRPSNQHLPQHREVTSGLLQTAPDLSESAVSRCYIGFPPYPDLEKYGQEPLGKVPNYCFSPGSRSASRAGARSVRSGPKSVAGTTVEARDAAGGRLRATLRAALSGRQGAQTRLPDVPASRRAPLLPCRPDSAAQTMTLVRNAG